MIHAPAGWVVLNTSTDPFDASVAPRGPGSFTFAQSSHRGGSIRRVAIGKGLNGAIYEMFRATRGPQQLPVRPGRLCRTDILGPKELANFDRHEISRRIEIAKVGALYCAP